MMKKFIHKYQIEIGAAGVVSIIVLMFIINIILEPSNNLRLWLLLAQASGLVVLVILLILAIMSK